MHGRGIGELLDAALDSLKKAERTCGFLTPSHLRRVALMRHPNVGKSSLLNQLTTRNTPSSTILRAPRGIRSMMITVDGEDWLFIDTAGIQTVVCTSCPGRGILSPRMRTQAAIERFPSLALVLFDASQPISDQDLKVMSQGRGRGPLLSCLLLDISGTLMDEFDRSAYGTPVEDRVQSRHYGL